MPLTWFGPVYQWDRTESLEIDRSKYVSSIVTILWQGGQVNSVWKGNFYRNSAGASDFHRERNKLRRLPHTIHENK